MWEKLSSFCPGSCGGRATGYWDEGPLSLQRLTRTFINEGFLWLVIGIFGGEGLAAGGLLSDAASSAFCSAAGFDNAFAKLSPGNRKVPTLLML